jgi:hypothetical protein
MGSLGVVKGHSRVEHGFVKLVDLQHSHRAGTAGGGVPYCGAYVGSVHPVPAPWGEHRCCAIVGPT